jgi:predicted ATPase/transcriptional regulator with XRE-family HTH domain
MTKDSTPAFGDLLRRARLTAGLTQEALAERAGISARAISDLERDGSRLPRKDTLDLLVEALELPPGERARWLALRRPAAERAQSVSQPRTALQALPIPPTDLLGREAELEAIISLLRRPGVRLVTLTGLGGIGKTRLALAVASSAGGDYRDGVVFVDLAPLRHPTSVGSAIALAVGVRNDGREPLEERLIAHLRPKHLLIVLDNFEHVLEAAPFVAELLSACQHLTVLVTSRAPLRLRAEHASEVPPLSHPDVERRLSFEEICRYPSIVLFTERAGAQTNFVLDEANASVVADICRRLDGIPLAIELAAARIRVLPPRALLDRLAQRLPLLTAGVGMRDLPLRQQTLHRAIGWSYDLLPDAAQVLFRRLAVFAGGWVLEAAQAVAGYQLELDVLDGLELLVDHHLVQQREQLDGSTRFRMLETIREYAWEQLAASGELDDVQRRHAAFFLALAEDAEAQIFGASQSSSRETLERDYDNVWAALSWAAGQGPRQAELQLRFSAALSWLWVLRGSAKEGRTYVERALSLEVPLAPRLRARALAAGAELTSPQGDLERTAALASESLVLWRTLGDQRGMANALRLLANVAHDHSDWDLAAQRYEAAMEHYRAVGDVASVARCLNNLGRGACFQEKYERASDLLRKGRDLSRQVGDRRGVAGATIFLGEIARRQGDAEGAIPFYKESLALHAELGSRWFFPECLRGLARSCAACGELERATRLAGAEEALREALGNPAIFIVPSERPKYAADLEALRLALGPEAFAAVWAEGRAMTAEEAVAYALTGAEVALIDHRDVDAPALQFVGCQQSDHPTANDRGRAHP